MLIGEGVTAWDVTSTAVSTHALSVTHTSFFSFLTLCDFPDAPPGRASLLASAKASTKVFSEASEVLRAVFRGMVWKGGNPLP
jgi:hypothetical protein